MKLIDNGKDSLKKSINALNNLDKVFGDDYEYKLKDIVINLHHSIETIFKYMIKEKNEFLVYSNCEEIFKVMVLKKLNADKSSDFDIKTIQFLDAVHRVIVLYDLDLKKDDYSKLKMLNNVRNSLTHYETEFNDNEIEHLIAMLLPIILKIFKEKIESFNQWARDNGIYSEVSKIEKDMGLWTVEQYYKFNGKWEVAKTKIELLDSSPELKGKIFKNKHKDKVYIECPVCHNKLFHILGTSIYSVEQVYYTGKCSYCDIEIDKIDAQFIALYYGEYEDYNYYGVNMIRDKMIQVLFAENTMLSTKDKIINTVVLNADAMKIMLNHKIKNEIKEVCEVVSENYFKDKINPYNDRMEDLIRFDGCEVNQDLAECLDDEDGIKTIKNILELIDKIKIKNKELGSYIINYSNDTYISEHWGMYLDGEGEEDEREITVNMTFNYEDVFNYLFQDK